MVTATRPRVYQSRAQLMENAIEAMTRLRYIGEAANGNQCRSVYFKACAVCGGDVVHDRDSYGERAVCVQAGHETYRMPCAQREAQRPYLGGQQLAMEAT